LGESVNTIKEYAEDVIVAIKETGLEANDDKSKYMFISRDQNAGRSPNLKNDIISFERVEEFQNVGTTLTNQNSIQEEIKRRFKSVNACYNSAVFHCSFLICKD
jgi:hypothetical protein